MAKIGLNNFRYAIATIASDGTVTYGVAKQPAKAISCKVDVSNSSATLYADDALRESDTSFTGGTVTIGIDDDDTQTLADFLGHKLDGAELVRNIDDYAPYVGFGRVIVKMVGGVKSYKVEFLSLVKFSEPSQEDNTKGESLEFGTYELEGTIVAPENGVWSKTRTFTTKSDAIHYLEGLMNTSSHTEIFKSDGSTKTVTLNYVPSSIVSVSVNSTELDSSDYSVSGKVITFGTLVSIPNGATIIVHYTRQIATD